MEKLCSSLRQSHSEQHICPQNNTKLKNTHVAFSFSEQTELWVTVLVCAFIHKCFSLSGHPDRGISAMRRLAGTLTVTSLFKGQVRYKKEQALISLDPFYFPFTLHLPAWPCLSHFSWHFHSSETLWEVRAGCGWFPLLHLLNKTFTQSFHVVGTSSSSSQANKLMKSCTKQPRPHELF